MAVQNSTRKWVFIGVGVVAAVALVAFFQNYPPQPTDSAATIGAAQRYHSTQITGADVKVSQDELTTWIQSDTFDRIVKDPQARKLFTDAAVISMFNDAAHKLDSARSLDADGLTKKMDADGLTKKMDADGLTKKMDADGLTKKMDADGLTKKMDADGLTKKMDADGLTKKMDADGLTKKMDADGLTKKLDADGLSKKLDADGLTKKLDADGMRKQLDALDNAALRSALEDKAFLNAISKGNLMDGLVNQARIADTAGSPE